jgi:hypothetical protein
VNQEVRMARQVVVQVFCDLCESTEGAGPVEFAIDRSAFEIDLCAEHRAAFTTALAPFVSSGRTARSRGASASTNAPTHRRVVRRDPAQTEAIRRWAKENGFAISGRGRIPGTVEAAYNARGTN